MAGRVADQHYGRLSAQERFALLLEAMARRDEREADRLEDTCPRQTYRGEDQAFRGRMLHAYMIASRAWLDLQPGLAQLRMAVAFQSCAGQFAGPVARLAQAALLYGRAYGRWEAGAIETVGLPDAKALADEVAADPELGTQLEELRTLAGEAMELSAGNLLDMVGRVHATDLLSRWDGFGRFCRQSLGLEPLVLMRAFGLGCGDVEAEVRAACPDAAISDAAAAAWAGQWTRTWQRRFAAG
jgi:hypothetical protein